MEHPITSWSLQLAQLSKISDLRSDHLERAVEAFNYLDKTIGTIHYSQKHPLVFPILNQVAQSRMILIELAEGLKYFENDEMFAKLKQKIKDRDRCQEGLSLIEASKVFRDNGWSVSMIKEGSTKSPDFLLLHTQTNLRVYMEVSVLERNLNQIAHERFMWLTAMKNYQLDVTFELYRNLSPAEEKSLISEVNSFLAETKGTGEFATFYKPEYIRLGAGPIEKRKELEEWAKQYNLRPGVFAAPQSNYDPIKYVQRKLQRKQRQFDSNFHNIIWIKLQGYHLPFYEPVELIERTLERMNQFRHIHAIVLTDITLGSLFDPGVYQIGKGRFFVCVHKDYGRVEHRIIAFNPDHDIDPVIFETLLL
ncbi:MAG: hypothetical protein ACKVOK_12630 [Flavobacteriales bacterium]